MSRRRHRRPVSVSIIAWLMLVAGVIGLLSAAYAYDTPAFARVVGWMPMPPWLALGARFAGDAAAIFCGIFLLKGSNWARYLYLGWVAASCALNYHRLAPRWGVLLVGAGILLIPVVFLFLPKASSFFGRNRHHHEASPL